MNLIERFPRSSAWLSFFAGLTVVLWIDLTLRRKEGTIYDGGLNEVLYYGIPLVLAGLSVVLIWNGVKIYKKRIISVIEILTHLTIGYFLYILYLLNYVTYFEIDSL